MYLIATVNCLQILSYCRGGQRDILDSARLTNTGYWYPSTNSLFADCQQCAVDSRTAQIKCLKVAQHLEQIQRTHKQGLIPPTEGAVIFGSRVLQKLRPSSPPPLSRTTAQKNEIKLINWVIRTWKLKLRNTP